MQSRAEGSSPTATRAAHFTSMKKNTSDHFFSVVVGLAVIAWPSIEEAAANTATGASGVTGETLTPGQYSEETRVPPSQRKKQVTSKDRT